MRLQEEQLLVSRLAGIRDGVEVLMGLTFPTVLNTIMYIAMEGARNFIGQAFRSPDMLWLSVIPGATS